MVNQLALSALPKEFPAFALTPTARERIAFLSGEPDRWRNTPDLALKHCNGPDHYIDLEELAPYGLKPETLPLFRYDFIAHLAHVRAAHPEKFPAIDPAKNTDHTRDLVGLLPWTITEYYSKLKSEFSYLKAFETAGGTPDEIANAQANILYTMGVMGHFVGDASQPLHTTTHFNGWIGENPHQYTTTNKIHAWIDGGFIFKAGVEGDLEAMKKKLRPAQIPGLSQQTPVAEQLFSAIVHFLGEQNKLVEPLYQMDKDHRLTGEGELGLQGKELIEGQLVKGGQLLADIWYSAWQQAPVDSYLQRQLEKRKAPVK
jgi:hypothetical protein